MKKTIALMLLLSCSAVFTGEVSTLTTISGSSLLASKSLGTISVLHANDGFKVFQNGKKHVVQHCWTDKTLRNKTPKQVAAFLAAGGKFSVKKIDNEQFKLTANTPGLGGGPVAGLIAYGVTKVVCYGTALAAVGTVTVATGGAINVVAGAAITGAGAFTGGTVAAATLGGAITTAGLATEAVAATATVLTATGTIAGAVATVEAASGCVGVFFLAIPFLP